MRENEVKIDGQKRLLSKGISIILLALAFVPVADAEIANHVVISEVYVNAFNDSGSEWIELYNPTNSVINISMWTIGTPTSSKDATIPTGVNISACGFYLIADEGFSTKKDNSSWPNADHEETITLGSSDSWVCLNDSSGTKIDLVGWGSNAPKYEGTPFTPNPQKGKSLQRRVNDTITENGYGPAWDSNNNSADFFIQAEPNPQNRGAEAVPPVPELPSIILLAFGLLMLATYIVLKRRDLKNR